MGNAWSLRKFLLRDITRPEKLEREPIQFLSDNQVLQYSPERMEFYNHLWESWLGQDPTVVDKVLGIEMRNRKQYEDVQKSVQDVAKSINNLDRIHQERDRPVSGGNNSIQSGGTWFSDKLREFKEAKEAKDIYGQERIYNSWKTNPVFSPDVEKVSTTDRVVFIAMTFLIRVLTLYLIEWGINNRMITSFEKAFWYYFMIYLSFVILWVMLVNINKDDILFRLLFYYVNTNTSKGLLRIAVHCIVQVLLLPIPFILRETTSPSFLNFEERRNIINTLSNFTMFVWVLTSAIAIRV